MPNFSVRNCRGEYHPFQTVIDVYTPLVTKPRQAIVARKTVTTDSGATQDGADAFLKEELDRSIRKFLTKNPPFFNEYNNARMIIDLGERADKPPTPPPPTPKAGGVQHQKAKRLS